MNNRLEVITSIFKKDLIGLAPLSLLVIGLTVLETLITELDLGIQSQTWVIIKLAAPYISKLAIGLLIIAAFQLDPPSSLTHDWLIRPVRKLDLFLSKILYLFVIAFLPLVLARLALNLVNGYSFTESILEASVFKTVEPMLTIPIFICVAILTRTMLQALAVVVGLLLFIGSISLVPVLTTPNADKMNFTGYEWLLSSLSFVIIVTCLAFVARFQYYRRDFQKARLSIAAALGAGIVTIFVSFQLPLWPLVFSTQSRLTNELDDDLTASLMLDSIYSCYPAVMVGNDIYGDAETPAEGMIGMAGLNYFTAWELESAGPGGIAFSTQVQARNIPRKWRLLTVNAVASISSMDGEKEFRLAPAAGSVPALINTQSEGTHFWAVPEQVVEELSTDPSTELRLELDLALLAPTEYELIPGSQRRYFPGIGYCSAEIDSRRNELQVECFKRGARPTVVSAEIKGVSTSRVDATWPDFSPNFMQLFGGSHYEMNIPSPSLIENPTALITIYEQKAFFSKEISQPGLLGAEASTCPLPFDMAEPDTLRASWSDRSPHQASFINVDRDVRLEVLEWSHPAEPELEPDANEPVFVLLAGGGATAHSFDDIAPRLASQYRTIALTRRGFGASSKPTSGYHISRLSEDVIEVMNAMHIEKAILVGHSLAGDELSALAADYPDRVSGLVYLDAAYDRSKDSIIQENNFNRFEPPRPRPLPQELASYSAAQSYFDRIDSVGIPEGAFMASFDFSSHSRIIDQRFGEAIMAQLDAPRYEQISAPTVSIYAIEKETQRVRSWYDPDDELLINAARRFYQLLTYFQREQISAFRSAMPQATVIEIQGGDHSIFISHEDEVFDAMIEFAESIH
ncbi:MAG: hypothetical protein COB20_00470 [SAR86 cluster bacterium]|uniref:AB hydrolase-1 domain-containing protein n=1 Tax=SAR86 cluster bacterium TaxID=2030880 RepID=A0A2A4XJD3_9GAMM|nr:MAG: hypothetical protein COB20_00470 [SAR86 cluster bacterium]